MELQKIIDNIEHPENLLDIGGIEDMIDWCTHHIYTLELELADLDFIVDSKRLELIERHEKVNKAEAMLKLTDEYRERHKKELTLKSIKAYRANIRKKRDRMANFR